MSTTLWESAKTGAHIELGLLSVDVVGHRSITGSEQALHDAKLQLNRHVEAIAKAHGGRQLAWAGDGGTFMFRMDEKGMADDLVLAAHYVLSIVPGFNAEVAVRFGLQEPIRLRICCDFGMVVYNADPRHISGEFVNNFVANEKEIGQPNTVVVTERLHRRLTLPLRAMFRPLSRPEQSERCFIHSPLLPKRQESIASLERLLADARNMGAEFCVCGVANTEFFGASGHLNPSLRAALQDGLKARFVFLDPHSVSAVRRRIFEMGRLDAIGEINTCLQTAVSLRTEFPDSLRIRLTDEMPAFMCLSGREALVHPYLASITGHDTPTWVWDGEAYGHALRHFNKIWGERWVLFDLGNVLVRFNHERVSRGLLRLCRRSGSKRSVSREAIHSFIFHPRRDVSRNMELDRGERDLAWLCAELRREFGVRIEDQQMRGIWSSVFDQLDRDALSCLAELRAQGTKVAICSNTNLAHWEHLSTVYPELANPHFEKFLSFEMRAIKPDQAFFRKIVDRTRCPFEHHLLIDDLDVNIAAARDVGMRAEAVRSPVRISDVEHFLRERYWM